ncbi:MAG TPA: SGNH/GDSL hydrolase family protein [Thermoanaerobaculia bacterium]
MRIKSLSRIAAVLAVVLLVALPTFAARGTADFTRFVALGDSYGAGVESGSLNVNHQPFSWPAIIARQAGAPDFQQPLVSFPGIGAELQIVDILSFPPNIQPAPGGGQPINSSLPRPFNNLSIPGAQVGDLTTLTGKEPVTSTASAFAQFILRGRGTEVQQAVAQNPTFIALWIGGNDVLGGALAGTPKTLTSVDSFRTAYTKMLDQLIAGAPNAGIIVGNLPTVSIPILSTVPALLINPVTQQPVLLPNGAPIQLLGDPGDGNPVSLPLGTTVLLPCAAQISTGVGIPAFLKADPRFASLPNIGKPLPDACTLTPAETAQIVQRTNDFNQIISDAAGSRNIPVADIKGLFDRFAVGVHVGPFAFNSSFITGGLFSLDGLHLTDIGYTLFANQYLRTINSSFGTHIPLASIATLMANNGAFFPEQHLTSGNVFIDGMQYAISEEAAKLMLQFARVPEVKHRAIAH